MYFFFCMTRVPPESTRMDTLLPDTTLFRSLSQQASLLGACRGQGRGAVPARGRPGGVRSCRVRVGGGDSAPGGREVSRGRGGLGAAKGGVGHVLPQPPVAFTNHGLGKTGQKDDTPDRKSTRLKSSP